MGVLATQIWAPLMTHPDQYVPYLISRFFAAFFGFVVALLGPPYLVDMFYLHQRGRAFTLLHFAINFGVSASPTFSGFVAAESYWPVEYWWSVGLTAFSLIPAFLFLEETGFDRTDGAVNRTKPDSRVKDRIETFFPGNKVMPARTWRETVRERERERERERDRGSLADALAGGRFLDGVLLVGSPWMVLWPCRCSHMNEFLVFAALKPWTVNNLFLQLLYTTHHMPKPAAHFRSRHPIICTNSATSVFLLFFSSLPLTSERRRRPTRPAREPSWL